MVKYPERDWKLFRKRLPDWQKKFMENLNKEYIEILNRDDLASNNFWELEKRINKDKKKTGVVARMSRSKMFTNLVNLCLEGVISLDDLDGFTEELQEDIKNYIDFIDKYYETEEEE